MYTRIYKNKLFLSVLLILLFSATYICITQNVFAQIEIRGGAVNVLFEKTLDVTGALSKGSGSFVIDHPLDPENKLLYHSFVESPDVKNIYDGIVTLDSAGEAVVTLPEYFGVLHGLGSDFTFAVDASDSTIDVRFLLTAVGAPAPDLYIKDTVRNNQFTIAGGPANAKVSWQVTGIRKDPYIIANPIVPEVEKGPDELRDKGEYLFEGYDVATENIE